MQQLKTLNLTPPLTFTLHFPKITPSAPPQTSPLLPSHPFTAAPLVVEDDKANPFSFKAFMQAGDGDSAAVGSNGGAVGGASNGAAKKKPKKPAVVSIKRGDV